MSDGLSTYQGLERLTHMPDRADPQGDRIAGQYFYDIKFTGGEITGVSIGDPTFTSPLSVPNGGTGVNTLTFNSLLKGNGANPVVSSGIFVDSGDNMTLPTGGSVFLDDSITAAGADLPLAFDGDPDTGLFRPSANNMGVSAGAIELMRFNGGTTPPNIRAFRAIQEVTGSSLASAATVDLGTATGNIVQITGTTTITSLGNSPSTGASYRVRFAGILTLTHSGNLILPTSANIVTAAGDIAWFTYEGSSVWRCYMYTRADGTALNGAAVPGGANTQVQFNDSGVFGGDSGLTFNKTTDQLSVGGIVESNGKFQKSGAALTGTMDFQDSSGNVRGQLNMTSGMFSTAGGGFSVTPSTTVGLYSTGLDLTTTNHIAWRVSTFGAFDTGLSRVSAGKLAVGTGATGNSGGILLAQSLEVNDKPTTQNNILPTQAAKTFLTSDGTNVSFTGTVMNSNNYLFVRDEKTSGTNGGSSTSGATAARVLNTVVVNTISGASLASNQVTLPAGTFYIKIRAPTYSSALAKARLYNITTAAYVLEGASSYSGSPGGENLFITGTLILASSTVLEVRHYVQTGNGAGFGQASSQGTEIYTEFEAWKVG